MTAPNDRDEFDKAVEEIVSAALGLGLYPSTGSGPINEPRARLRALYDEARKDAARLRVTGTALLDYTERLETVLHEVRSWRRAAVGLEPTPKSDAEGLGGRIDAALAAGHTGVWTESGRDDDATGGEAA